MKLGALLFSLCTILLTFSAAGAVGKAAPPVVVGGTVSLSGPYIATSAVIHNTLKLWENQINQAGGLLGRPVKLMLYDDQSDTAQTIRQYRRLLKEDRVDLVVSPYGTTLTLAASEVSERHGKVMLAMAASGGELWRRGHKHLFGVYAPAGRYFVGVPDLMARHGFKTLAIINEYDAFSADAAEGAAQWARRFGVKVVWRGGCPADREELDLSLEAARASGAAGLVVCSYPAAGYRILQELKVVGWRPKVLAMSITPALSDFAAKAGDWGEGVIAPSQWEPNAQVPFPGTRAFIRDYRDSAGEAPSYHAAATYTALTLLAQAVTATGSLDQNKIRDYIRSLDTVSLLGRFKVDADGRQIGHSPLLIQWQGGKKEIVYPPKMRTAPLRY